MISFSVTGIEKAQAKLEALADVLQAESRRFVDRATAESLDRAKVYTSLTDHTLKELAALGHPYARRFAPNTLHPDHVVHAQSGTLTSGLHQETFEAGNSRIIGVVRNEVWYDRFIQLGTWKMRPRPYMSHVLQELGPGFIEAIRHIVSDAVRVVSGRA